jgi:hypothetical protein
MNMVDYQEIAGNHDRALRKEIKKAILNCKVFSNFDEKKVDYLVSIAKLKYYDISSEVLSAGQSVKDLCIIRSGVVKLVKAISESLLYTPPSFSAPTTRCQTSVGNRIGSQSMSSAFPLGSKTRPNSPEKRSTSANNLIHGRISSSKGTYICLSLYLICNLFS